MGSNSTQGFAVLLFLAAFTLLSLGVMSGNWLYIGAFAVGLVASVMLFLKAKPMEHAE